MTDMRTIIGIEKEAVPIPTKNMAMMRMGLSVRKSNKKAMTNVELEASKLYFSLLFNMYI